MAHIIVTGGAGYIGSHTIIELIQKGHEVTAIDNYSNSSAATYDRIFEITGVRIPFYECDLADSQSTERLFAELSKIDGIIHFAALKSVPDSVAHPLRYYRNNNNSLLNILAQVAIHDIHATIFSSSCSVYGNLQADQLPVTEDTQMKEAECPYANTKQMGEDMLKNFAVVNSNNFIALRYFNPVGAHPSGLNGEMPAKVVNNLGPIITQAAAGLRKELTVFGDDYDTRDGSCIRDYIHVVDIAKAHVQAIEYALSDAMEKNYDVINLGSGNGVSVLEAIQAFEKTTGVKVPYVIGPRRAGDVVAIYSDSTKAEKMLQWTCKYDINDIMSSAWKWQKKLME